MSTFSALASSPPSLSALDGSSRYSPVPSPVFSLAGLTPFSTPLSTAVGSYTYSPAPSPLFLSAGPTSSPSPRRPDGTPLPARSDLPSFGSLSLFLLYWLSSRSPPARPGLACVPSGPLLRFSAYLVQPGLFITPLRPRFLESSPFVQGPSLPLAPGFPVVAPLSLVPPTGKLEQGVLYTQLRAEYDRRG